MLVVDVLVVELEVVDDGRKVVDEVRCVVLVVELLEVLDVDDEEVLDDEVDEDDVVLDDDVVVLDDVDDVCAPAMPTESANAPRIGTRPAPSVAASRRRVTGSP